MFFVAVQSLSCIQLFVTPWTAACQVSLSFTISQRLLKHMSVKSVRPSNHLNLCHPLLLLTSIFPRIKVFSNELALCIQWPKNWSFNISPSNDYSGLIYFRIDWFYLFAVQGTLKNLLQQHNLKYWFFRIQQNKFTMLPFISGLPWWLRVKVTAWNSGDPVSIPGSGRSPGEGNGNPLQYSCLENPMDGGAW